MFKELVEKKRYSFHEGFADWREAVRAACQPLLADGTIEPEYSEAIIGKVEELGPYIVIAPDICIPHAQEGVGVNDTAVCFMKTEQPVSFSDDGEHDARLFFVLASTDNARHRRWLICCLMTSLWPSCWLAINRRIWKILGNLSQKHVVVE